MPLYLNSIWKLITGLKITSSQIADTDWEVVEHYRRGWVTMSDGARTNPEFYMRRVCDGVVQTRRATPHEAASHEQAVEDRMNAFP